jgi:hypothetical protein
MDSNDRFISYLPLAHVAERMLIEQASLRYGGRIFFAESLDTFLQDLQRALGPPSFSRYRACGSSSSTASTPKCRHPNSSADGHCH